MSKTVTYLYFMVIDGNVYHLETEVDSLDDPEEYYRKYLEDEHDLSPNWEAVGVQTAIIDSDSRRGQLLVVPVEPMYEIKKQLMKTTKQTARDLFDEVMFEEFEFDAEKEDKINCITFGRDESGKWIQKDAPPMRSVDASCEKNYESGPHDVEGWDMYIDKNGHPSIYVDFDTEMFAYLCDENEARYIQNNKKIEPSEERTSDMTALSLQWTEEMPTFGGFVPSYAVVFKTDQKPDSVGSWGVKWDNEVTDIDVVSIVPSDQIESTLGMKPLPPVELLSNKLDKGINRAGGVNVIYDRPEINKEARKPNSIGIPGGPCHIIRDIEEENLPSRLEDELIDDIQKGKDLSNSDANEVYEHKRIRTGIDLFGTMKLTSHAQYRMNERGITVDDLKSTLENFQNWYKYRQKEDDVSRENQQKLYDLAQGDPIRFEDFKSGLTIVFAAERGSARLVTTWWEGHPDPNPPGPDECEYIPYLDKEKDLDRPKILGSTKSVESSLREISSFLENKLSTCGDSSSCGNNCDCGGDCNCGDKESYFMVQPSDFNESLEDDFHGDEGQILYWHDANNWWADD